MTTFILRRVYQSVFVMLGVSLVAFLLVHLSGDPIKLMLPFDASPEQIAQTRAYWGLDDPLPLQYGRFLGRVAQGDLGSSMKHSQSVAKLIGERLRATTELAVLAMAFALLVAIPVGVFSAVRPYSLWDNLATVLALTGRSMPVFWLGLLLILVFAVQLGWVPPSGRGDWKQLLLPSITLGTAAMATLTRLTRSSLLDELGQDYLRTARAKGLAERAVVYAHGLRNAWVPLVTVAGLQFAALLGGALVTESVFAWPGLGLLTVRAIYDRDLPLIQGATLFFASVFVLMNLLVDILYAYLDPRIRRQ
jgi:ABC-type dipeptide/oligopeptide/nickel transport system permease component